eukprot:402041_1
MSAELDYARKKYQRKQKRKKKKKMNFIHDKHNDKLQNIKANKIFLSRKCKLDHEEIANYPEILYTPRRNQNAKQDISISKNDTSVAVGHHIPCTVCKNYYSAKELEEIDCIKCQQFSNQLICDPCIYQQRICTKRAIYRLKHAIKINTQNETNKLLILISAFANETRFNITDIIQKIYLYTIGTFFHCTNCSKLTNTLFCKKLTLKKWKLAKKMDETLKNKYFPQWLMSENFGYYLEDEIHNSLELCLCKECIFQLNICASLRPRCDRFELKSEINHKGYCRREHMTREQKKQRNDDVFCCSCDVIIDGFANLANWEIGNDYACFNCYGAVCGKCSIACFCDYSGYIGFRQSVKCFRFFDLLHHIIKESCDKKKQPRPCNPVFGENAQYLQKIWNDLYEEYHEILDALIWNDTYILESVEFESMKQELEEAIHRIDRTLYIDFHIVMK